MMTIDRLLAIFVPSAEHERECGARCTLCQTHAALLALHAALRRTAIDGHLCMLCKGYWDELDGPEQHARECLAAPLRKQDA